jgi:mono/diheme cytochrome c family protein
MVTRIFGAVACVMVVSAAAHAQDNTLGKTVFEKKGNCAACHGTNASGTPMGPNLRDTVWLNVDGSVDQIRQLVRTGVMRPRQYPGMMPAMGGAKLANDEMDAVAQYVVTLRQTAASPSTGHVHGTSAVPADGASSQPRRCGCCGRHAAMHSAKH